jgi:hypothetical protein
MNRFTVLSAILGFALFAAGAALIYRPLGLLASGSMLLFLAFTTARRKKS